MIEVGKYYSVDKNLLKSKLIDQQKKMLASILKNNGENQVYIVSLDATYAYVAASPYDAILGTLRIPIEAIKE